MTTLFNRLRKGQKGFTLIELLVVVAIIALLAAFAVPKLFDAINKSKGSRGTADLVTISDALERHYFDRNSYPTDVDNTIDNDQEVMDALTHPATINGVDYPALLKGGTKFTNGFEKGFVYFTNATGGYYVAVDPGNQLTNFVVVCGTDADATNNWTTAATHASDAFQVVITGDSPTATQMAQGCSLEASGGSGFNPAQASLRTN